MHRLEGKLEMRRLTFAAIVSCSLMGCDSSGQAPTHFDRKTWLATPARSREMMATDLVDRKVLVGLTLDQVKALLGPPSFESSGYVTYVVQDVTVLDIRFSAIEPHLVETVFTRVM
ncbi:MAG: hypothetical protein ACJ8G1_07595 [Vitreoscilla sp.]